MSTSYACLTLAAQCTYLAEEMFLKEGLISFRDIFAQLVSRGGDDMRPYARPAYLSMLAEVSPKYLRQMDDVSAVLAFDLDTIVGPGEGTAASSSEAEARARRQQSLLDEYDERIVISGLLCREAEDLYYIGMQLGPGMLGDGLLNYRNFFSELVRVMGDRVRPLVKHIYMALMADVDAPTLSMMDTLDAVRSFDELTVIDRLGTAQTRARQQQYRQLTSECRACRKRKDAGRRRFTPSQVESMTGIALLLASAAMAYDIFFNLFFQNVVTFGTIFVLFLIPVAIALLLRYLLRFQVVEGHVPLVFFLAVLLPWLFLRTNVWFASGPVTERSYPVYSLSEDAEEHTCSVFIRWDDAQLKRFDFTPASGYTRRQVHDADLVSLSIQRGLWGLTVIRDVRLVDAGTSSGTVVPD